MANKPNGTLYTGVTSDLLARAYQHKTGQTEGFTARYGLKRLVYYEVYEAAVDAIQREKNIKKWPRQWKVNLIVESNPKWRDLYKELNF